MIPAAIEIYEGIDLLKAMPAPARQDQQKEFREACPSASTDTIFGYELGLAVARAILKTSEALLLAGVKPEDVL
jgi:hypothetical protein